MLLINVLYSLTESDRASECLVRANYKTAPPSVHSEKTNQHLYDFLNGPGRKVVTLILKMRKLLFHAKTTGRNWMKLEINVAYKLY